VPLFFFSFLLFQDDVCIEIAPSSLMCRLVCDSSERLGAKGGAKEILAHPFFKGLDVENIRTGESQFFDFSSSFLLQIFEPALLLRC